MNLLAFYILTATLVGLAASQSLVLVGGGLTDGNAEIWNKVVTLAVRRTFNSVEYIRIIINF
jgi:hypothetical protein